MCKKRPFTRNLQYNSERHASIIFTLCLDEIQGLGNMASPNETTLRSWKEVNGWKFQPHVRFVLDITSKMTGCSVTNVALSSAVIYLLDPIKCIQNLHMHRQFQNACKRYIVKMHLSACPLLPNPHYLRPLHVLYVTLLSHSTWLSAFALCFAKTAVVSIQENPPR